METTTIIVIAAIINLAILVFFIVRANTINEGIKALNKPTEKTIYYYILKNDNDKLEEHLFEKYCIEVGRAFYNYKNRGWESDMHNVIKKHNHYKQLYLKNNLVFPEKLDSFDTFEKLENYLK